MYGGANVLGGANKLGVAFDKLSKAIFSAKLGGCMRGPNASWGNLFKLLISIVAKVGVNWTALEESGITEYLDGKDLSVSEGHVSNIVNVFKTGSGMYLTCPPITVGTVTAPCHDLKKLFK